MPQLPCGQRRGGRLRSGTDTLSQPFVLRRQGKGAHPQSSCREPSGEHASIRQALGQRPASPRRLPQHAEVDARGRRRDRHPATHTSAPSPEDALKVSSKNQKKVEKHSGTLAHMGSGGVSVGRRGMKMRENQTGYTVVPFARFQHQMIDGMELMHRQHTVHALLEVDVTDARTAIRESRAATREPLSFTAFIVASLAHAVAEDRRMHAYRKGRRQLNLFDDVDVAVTVEREMEGEK